jgi:MFS family permease
MQSQEFRLHRFILPFYVPAFIWSTGAGFLLPILPLYIRSLGASLTVTGVIMAMMAIGVLIGNFPTVSIIARVGKKRAMMLALVAEAALGLAASAAQRPWLLAPILLGLGIVHTLFFVARLAYFRELVPVEKRGRALSLLGGEARMGSSIGPVIGGLMADRLGVPSVFILFALVSSLVAVLVWIFVPKQETPVALPVGERVFPVRAIIAIIADYRRVFLTAGFAVLALKFVREGRKVIFPLWGDYIGMSASQIGVLFSISYIGELVLFYPAGWIMDRWGRKKTGVPCLILFAAGFFLLPLALTPQLFLLVAIFVAVGNGLGSGINMTLSTDFAPQDRIVEFLVAWRVLTDTGGAVSPIVIGVVASMAGLAWSSPVIGGAAVIGALIMAWAVGEPLASGSADIRTVDTPLD